MTDLAVIGIGRVGRLALELLSRVYSGLDIVAIDCRDLGDNIKRIDPEIRFYRACSPSEALKYIQGASVAAVALPSGIARDYIVKLLENSVNVVDVSFIDFNPYDLEDLCRRNNVYYVVDAGFAPGFSNLVVGRLHYLLGELDRVAIYVGGIPVEPVPPIGYQITWSPEDLIEEYIRPAHIVVDGVVKTVDPLDEIVEVEIPGAGVFEGFYSDGLRTLLHNVRAREMYEITIRHRGHLKAMRILRDLGFFSREPIVVNGVSIKPYRFTARIFENVLRQTVSDMALLYIDIVKSEQYYRLFSRLIGSHRKPATPYYTALVFVETIALALDRDLGVGIHPLEDLHIYYRDYIMFLEKHGVEFTIDTNIEA